MFAMGICRFDAGAEGIHLAWNAPDVLCVSSPGFDIQRRIAQSGIKYRCYSMNTDQIVPLRTNHELASPLGMILYSQTGPLQPIDPSPGTSPWPAATGTVDRYTYELSSPTNHVRISCLVPATLGLKPFAVFAIALSGGKAIAFATNPGDNTTFELEGNEIDSAIIFTISPITLTVCVAPPADADGTSWDGATYIVKGLTLPVHEADPSLTTPAAELAAAVKRLVTGDVFTAADFANLAPPLRAALLPTGPGRAGERILLGRTTPDDPYQEVAFGDQLTLLQIFPALRRVLGFGYFDREANGLAAGQTYEYRITGHFNAAEIQGNIYDFHTIPSGSVLPATFYVQEVRFSFKSPVSVVLDPAPSATGLNDASRRGIRIRANTVLPGWTGPSLDTWDAIVDLPYPTASLTLELNAAQRFVYAVGDGWAFAGTVAALPAGAAVALSFTTPITQLRLAGSGVLFAIRVPAPAQSGTVPVSVTTPPIPFTAQPLPGAPLSLTIANLQAAPGSAVLTNVFGANPGPRRPLPGFDLAWLPAGTVNATVWPSGNTVPPIDAMIFQIEHRDVTLPSTFGPWEPILPGENISLGTRDNTLPTAQLDFASDVAQVFPSRRPRTPGAGYLFHLSDMFASDDTSEIFKRPIPAFGTYHQYRIRAVDTVGRVSADWTLSNVLRLEKHVPPPLPVGPQPEPALIENADGTAQFASPPGVKARALVVNDPAHSANDLAILGTHQNAIVLEWGWRDIDRQTDKLTTEFRVYYLHLTPDSIPGQITSVTAAGQGWDLGFKTDRTLKGGECVGQWLSSNGYPFRIGSLTAGPPVTVHVEAPLANPGLAPVVGQAFFGRPLSSDHQRPANWESRAAVIPLTSAQTYQYVFYDLLDLSPENPTNSIWVGVSAADSQDYVPDELPAVAMNGGRPGNESSIVTCAVTARDSTRPVFSLPPPIGDVPELLTEEPGDRQILVTLDLEALVAGALPAGTPIGLDRCSVDTLLSITSLDSSNRVQLALNDGSSQIVSFPNPTDEAEVVATLQGPNPERLASRYQLYLATHHSRPDEIFPRISGDILGFGAVSDRLPPKPARFFYRVRQADALGRISADGAILPVVVRVPSIAPPAAPQKVSISSTPTSATITLRVPGDPDIAWLLVFSTMLPVASPITDLSGAELLRVPNRRDLYPLNGLRLRHKIAPGLLLPMAKSLADPDVTIGADGSCSAAIQVPAAFGNYVILWSYSLSLEGIPSKLAGPFTWGVPKT
jgi:hypothetical protein